MNPEIVALLLQKITLCNDGKISQQEVIRFVAGIVADHGTKMYNSGIDTGRTLAQFDSEVNGDANKVQLFEQALLDTLKSHFRTVSDTGTNAHAMIVWNSLMNGLGRPSLTSEDLNAYCTTCKKYHQQKGADPKCVFGK